MAVPAIYGEMIHKLFPEVANGDEPAGGGTDERLERRLAWRDRESALRENLQNQGALKIAQRLNELQAIIDSACAAREKNREALHWAARLSIA